ncbi:NAD(P)/FAD-dependent oxidoreductase [Kutzneria albida]|uniref:Amine oxidase domain-containing protein n=1 Tax=Kutzneria albida DSM 43870 TaxID=1449976 RepID=W5WG71_9PSEU|nr:FAD-dependent oxidoreductase [Kutzneria albida]AHI00179.1 hypothetical protein KALB_6820 [Kutzneria albida DSM 43870]
MTVTVIGAGVAGLACARALVDAGVAVTVLERDTVVGGRLSTESHEGRPTDVGAAYFTVSDPGFEAVVTRWRDKGLARPWTDTLTAIDRHDHVAAPGPMRWAAPRGLRSLAADLAAGLPVTLGRAVRSVGPGPVVDGSRADHVVLAMPGPEALPLLAEDLSAARAAAAAQRWQSSIAVTLRYAERTWRLRGAFVNGHGQLRMICDDGSRRGDDAPVLVAHTTAEYTAEHLDNPERAAEDVVQALSYVIGLRQQPLSRHVRLWRYAQPEPVTEAPFHLDEQGIGLCGDAWGATPRVQTAWLSGTALGQEIARRLLPG